MPRSVSIPSRTWFAVPGTGVEVWNEDDYEVVVGVDENGEFGLPAHTGQVGYRVRLAKRDDDQISREERDMHRAVAEYWAARS